MTIVATDKEVKLGSPAKSPSLIDAIWLEDNSLCTTHEIKEHQSHNSASKPRPRENRIVARWYNLEPRTKTVWEAPRACLLSENYDMHHKELEKDH